MKKNVSSMRRSSWPRVADLKSEPRSLHVCLAAQHDGDSPDGASGHAGGQPGDATLNQLADELRQQFGIAHATFQIEIGDGPECHLSPDNVI